MNLKRVRQLNSVKIENGNILYWMSRDQRVHDNWSLIFAQQLAIEKNVKLKVIFSVVPDFLNATLRQYTFMIEGLREVEKKLNKYYIPFYILKGQPDETIPEFIFSNNIGVLITDFDPLKIKKEWRKKILQRIRVPFFEVDSHNIVPSFYVSNKEEFGAYTIRPKIHKNLPEFLDEYPELKVMRENNFAQQKDVDWKETYKSLILNNNVKPLTWIKPGESEAHLMLESFIKERLKTYNSDRNNPLLGGQSNLSPYLHFGHISAQRIALNISKFSPHTENSEAFLEELIVRKELSDNFCNFNQNYDSFSGFKDWSKATLNQHRKDKREFLYSIEEFEEPKTHDSLWNAAQSQLLTTGKMHGYMRMYWAKKILEWTETPEDALSIAIYLNDKYELDGRDPNGYAGCAWSIGGIHDRAWGERPVFGKIRYMNYNGCKKKFNVDEYILMHKNVVGY